MGPLHDGEAHGPAGETDGQTFSSYSLCCQKGVSNVEAVRNDGGDRWGKSQRHGRSATRLASEGTGIPWPEKGGFGWQEALERRRSENSEYGYLGETLRVP